MEGELCSEVEFRILESVSSKALSATEIAKEVKLSLPHVLNQIKVLVAKKLLIQHMQKQKEQVGKPKKYYTIGIAITQITTIAPHKTVKHFVLEDAYRLTTQSALIANIQQSQNKEAISKYYWQIVEEFELIRALGFLSEGEHHVELLAITDEKHLESLRNQISKQVLKLGKQNTTISCWVHTEEEFIYGLLQGDEYYIKHMKRLQPMLDDFNILKQLKEKMQK